MGFSIATTNKQKALRLAEKHLAKGETRLATQIYAQVVEADPADIVTMNSLGDLYVRAQRIEEATPLFIQIAEAYRTRGDNLKHIAMLKKVIRLAPANIEVALQLGDLYLQNGLRVEAREQFIRVANACLNAGREQQAVEIYQRIIDFDPANVALRLRLAELYERREEAAQAHQHYLDAGCDLMHKDDLATALYACQKALDLRPDSNQALAAIARIYLQQGHSERALNLLQDACEKYAEDIEQLKLLGNTYLSLNRIEEAERTFQTVVERDPNNYYYLLAVGKIHLEAGKLERALHQFALCLENLIAMGDEDTAVDYLDKVLERDPDNLTALKLLAQVFRHLKAVPRLIDVLVRQTEAAFRQGDHDAVAAAMDELDLLSPSSVTYPAIEEMDMNLVTYDPEPEPASPAHEAFFKGEEVEALLDATAVYQDPVTLAACDSPAIESVCANTQPLPISDTGASEFMILAEEYTPHAWTSDKPDSATALLYSYLQDALLLETDYGQELPLIETEAALLAEMTAHDETEAAMTGVAEAAIQAEADAAIIVPEETDAASIAPEETDAAIIAPEEVTVEMIDYTEADIEIIDYAEAAGEIIDDEAVLEQEAGVEEIRPDIVVQQEAAAEENNPEVIVPEEAEVETISPEPAALECAAPVEELPLVEELPTVDDSNAAPLPAAPVNRAVKKSKRKTTTKVARKSVIPYLPVAVRPRAKRRTRPAAGSGDKLTRWIAKSARQSGDPTARKKRQESAYLKPLVEVKDFDQALKLIGEVDEILVDLTIAAEVKDKIFAAVTRLETEIAAVEEFVKQVQRSRQAAELADTIHCLPTLLAAFPAKPASFLNFKEDLYLETRRLIQDKVASIVQRLGEQASDHQCRGCSVCRSLEELNARLREKGLNELAQQCAEVLLQVNYKREERDLSLDQSARCKGRKQTIIAATEPGTQQDRMGRATPDQLASPKLGCYIWWQ